MLNRDRNRLRHQIELDQGFPKPVAKVPEVFGRGFYGHLKIDCFFLISLRLPGEISGFFTGYVHIYINTYDKTGTWWYRYRLQVSSRFPRFSSAHKNLVRKVQALLRPVLESLAHRLYDGIPCSLVSSSLLVKYFIIKKMKITIHFVWQRSRSFWKNIYADFVLKKIGIKKIENMGCPTRKSILSATHVLVF
eukprot:SAG11_NODE_43_length_20795_cov_11.860456_8_plen_192_part_00